MRGSIRWLLPLVVVAVAGVGVAMAATASVHASGGTVKAVKSKTFGMVLTSSSGRTLYRFTPDRKGVSVCTGACLKLWPALLVKAGSKPTVGAGASAALLGTIKAAHGMAQVTYAGFPLYFFAQDKKAGQMNGQGFQGKWYVVNANGALVKHAVKASAPAQPASTGSSTGSSAWG